jgi:hypothetical protein
MYCIQVEGRVYSLLRGLRLRHWRTSAHEVFGLRDAEDNRSMDLAAARGVIRARKRSGRDWTVSGSQAGGSTSSHQGLGKS